MKINILMFLVVFSFFVSCEKKELTEFKPSEILGTWLVVHEKRLSDNWTQSEENGITTDWQVKNPFANGMPVTSIRFNEDKTFYWNVDKVEDWEHFEKIRSGMPEDLQNIYSLENGEDHIALYTRFEYVGIIKTDTANFKMSMVKDHLILVNKDVQLKFIKTGL